MDLQIPTHGFRIVDDHDRELKTILEQIEHQHNVKVRVKGQDEPIEIYAASPMSARKAMDSILKSLVLREGHATVWQDSVLVAPPRGDKQDVRILLQESPGTPWFRPTAAPTGPDKVADSSAVQAYKTDLTAALVRVGDGLRYSPNRMRMRIGFGKLFFKERKKNTESYTLEDFSRLARRVTSRGTSYMEMRYVYTMVFPLASQGPLLTILRLGDESIRDKIQQALSLDPESFEPQGTENSVIVTTKNVNLEVTIDGNQSHGFTLGALNVYHREKSHRSVDLAMACPDK